MAWTDQDVADLKAAIGTGALKVRYADGREVTYRSLAEMREVLKMMQDDIAAGAGAGCTSRSSVAIF